MKVNNQAEYDAYRELNSHDGYSFGVITFSERWADLMEAEIPNYNTIDEMIAEKANVLSHEADTEGITGFMYGYAVAGLAKHWIHGDNLRRWHNKDIQIGTEGDEANENGGVLNPAVINIGIKSE